MSNTFIDIESIPQQPEDLAKAEIAETIQAPAAMKKLETIEAWHNGLDKYAGQKDSAIEEIYRKTALDGSKGQICSIAFAVGDNDIHSFTDKDSEAGLLDSFFSVLDNELNKTPPFFIGHYIAGFDLKFIFHRSVILGIRPPFELPFNGRHNQHYYDNMQAWAGYRERISQDNLCKALGIETKGEITGSSVWDYYKEGRINEIEQYNRQDVEQARLIYKKLNFIKG